MNTLVLQRYALPASVPIVNQHTWPLRIVATSTITGLPSEIFVFQAGAGNEPSDGDLFQCVASVHQISELTKSPVILNETQQQPFFRRNEVVWHCRSQSEADQLFYDIEQDAQELVTNFRAASELTLESTVTLS